MKIANGPVTLETNGNRENEGYHRWRDYHKSYPNCQRVIYVHQLVAIADGADPYKVFSDGAFEVNHRDGIIENNTPENLTLTRHDEHWNYHVNGGKDASD